ncbi:hypothetical protein N7G274_008100 [Stereocaulon virgatum]|uniref:GAR domain-containing protein n=1 Tax=Stereocaulon virgatum TaxID=373712 RepID=A0ABR4A280_9LECA
MDRIAPTPYLHFDHQSALSATSPGLSRSRSRREVFTDNEITPLLTNLSPSATLEALTTTNAVSLGAGNRQIFVQNSVASTSTSERVWGIKAALAGKKLREWHQELSGWPWPTAATRNGFQVPSPRVNPEADVEDVYWGSLPPRTVKEYEERIEAIKDDLETLEVQDLKNYVRTTHLRPGARRSSHATSTTVGGMDYEHLNDFTAVITAIIVQALPTLSRLNSLISAWSIRLSILRQVPFYLRDYDACKESMLSAWIVVGKSDNPTATRTLKFSRRAFLDIQAVLQDQIAQLGRKLDAMLDLLAGSEDTLPDQWCDEMDNLENEYSAWVVEAGELAANSEMDVERNQDYIMQIQNHAGHDIGQSSDMGGSSHALDVDAQSEKIPQRTDTGPIHDSKYLNKDGLPHNHDYRPPLDESVRNAGDTDGLWLQASDGPSQQHHAEEPLTGSFLRDNGGAGVVSSGSSPTTRGPNLATINLPLRSMLDSPIQSKHTSPNITMQTEDIDSEPKTSFTLPQRLVNRPSPLVLDRTSMVESTTSSELGSEISSPGSAISDYFSNKSSPEIRDASVVEYLASPILKSPVWPNKDPVTPLEIVSRHSSQRTERGDSRFPPTGSWSGFGTPVNQRSRASTYVPETSVREVQDVAEGERFDPPKGQVHVRTRSASMQSFEVVPKSEIRRIMVRRSESYSSPPDTSRLVPGLNGKKPQDTPFQVSGKKVDESEDRDTGSSVPLSLPKPRNRFSQVLDLGPRSKSMKITEKKPVDTTSVDHLGSSTVVLGHKASENVDDQLEARISSILTSIPAHIRLTSGPEPDAPEVTRFSSFSGLKTSASRTPASRLNRAQTSSPTMTLAPAQPKTSKSRSQSGEPEVKLYHLHQAGKDVPIKLFVRLVGEAGERVMVRIGGGWADLAEYLKDYATHHGRRAVSDSRFDIQGLPSSPLASQVSPTSRPVTPSSIGPPAMRKQQTTPGQFETPHTPASDPPLRPASQMSWTEEDSPSLGPAGPKTKRVDISPRKQAWVDEMLDQARQSGTENFGDMGKVGATKRVFLKTKTEE